MKHRPLTEMLVADGLCADRKQAAAWVMAGKVLVNDQPATAGMRVRPQDKVRLKDQLPFASKGGLKLEGALFAFGLEVKGLVCLDAGASTGGFTDCLLQRGARLVYAVDAGFGQLTGALRQDSRVVNLERTNLSSPTLLNLEPVPAFATCDLSYLSLREAVPVYRDILRGRGQLAALVKPLFEVEDNEARRSGVIADAAYAPMLRGLASYLNALPGVRVQDVCESPVTGGAGTLEFFFHIRFGDGLPPVDLEDGIARSVEKALELNHKAKAGDSTLE